MYLCSGTSYWRRFFINFSTWDKKSDTVMQLKSELPFDQGGEDWEKHKSRICKNQYGQPEAPDQQLQEEEDHANSGNPFLSHWMQALCCSLDHATMSIRCSPNNQIIFIMDIKEHLSNSAVYPLLSFIFNVKLFILLNTKKYWSWSTQPWHHFQVSSNKKIFLNIFNKNGYFWIH